ncbi:MAG: hypothetical protein M9934_00925 [Thermomicrobiales bacterium]|nr:hypothetical protein [Thermomicrobiales bacterium]MCO5226828.1 hypothetical protein [Thermomicrobiales bacterium]
MFRKWVRLFAALSIVLTSITGLAPIAIAEEGDTGFTMDSITRACDASRVDIAWTSDTDVKDVMVYLNNTSDNWSSTVPVSAPEDDGVSVEFDHHAVDTVTVDVVLQNGAEYRYEGQVGTCGVSLVSGGEGIPPTEPAKTRITISGQVSDGLGAPIDGAEVCVEVYVTNSQSVVLCDTTGVDGLYSIAEVRIGAAAAGPPIVSANKDGFWQDRAILDSPLPTDDVTLNLTLLPYEYAAVFGKVVDTDGNPIEGALVEMWSSEYARPLTFVTLADGSFKFDNWLISPRPVNTRISAANCESVSFWLPTSESYLDRGTITLDCEVGVVTPSPEASETPVAEANPVSIIVQTADGTSLAGAPFGIYAPAASTLPAGALFTGTVGANNTITIPDALPGAYVIKIAPAAGDLVEFGVQINPTTTLLVVGLDGEETVEFVQWDYLDETVFYPTKDINYDDRCGLEVWIVADQSGGKGTLTFTNAGGWKQVVEKDIPANHGTMSQKWCFDLTGSPDTITFDVVMNSGGRFFYHVTDLDELWPTIIGGRLVSTTPTPTETPTAPTETPTSQSVTVQVIMADGSSLAGAPFGVYAPAAATLPAGAIHTGTVEANNILTLPDLLPGDYVIRIAPVDGDLIEFTIEIGEDTDKLVVNLGQTDPGATETPAGTETPAATETATAEATKDATVDSLPQTGAGGSPSSLLLIVTAATVMVGGLAFVVRTGEVRRRA